jgi:PAS domain S-box-containing protein
MPALSTPAGFQSENRKRPPAPCDASPLAERDANDFSTSPSLRLGGNGELMQLALRAADMLAYRTDLATGETIVSSSMEDFFNVPSKLRPLPLDRSLEVIHFDDRERFMDCWRAAAQAGEPFSIEVRGAFPASNGGSSYYLMQGRVSRNPESASTQVLGVTVNLSERRQAEAAAREREQAFQAMLAACPVKLWLTDADFTGLRPGEDNDEAWISRIHPDDLPVHRATYHPGVERGKPIIVEYRVLQSSGEYRWIQDQALPRFDEQHRLLGYVGFSMDVTDRKLREAALQESERELRELVEISPANIWMTDAAGGCTALSPTWLRATGRTLAEQLGSAWLDWIHPEERSHVEQEYLAKFEAREPQSGEFSMLFADGEYHCVLYKGVPRYSPEGMFVGYTGMCLDITDRKRAEEAERAAERRLRTVTENVPGIVFEFVLRPDGSRYYTFISPSITRILGITPQEIMSDRATIEARLDGDDLSRVRATYERAGELGQPFQIEFPIRTREGTRRWARTSGTPRYLPDGAVAWTCIAYDITTLKETEEALRASEAEAHRASAQLALEARRKDEFLALMAHELRNPLAPIANVVESLQMRPQLDSELRSALELIATQTRHLRRLVDDSLDVSRISRGAIELKYSECDVARLLHEAAEMCSPQIIDGEHRLQVLLPDAPCSFECDPVRVVQMIANLLNNAAKHTRKRGLIHLSAERLEGFVTIRVSDNGIGIPAETLPRVFEMYYSSDRLVDRAERGMGIGLKLVRDLCELHGGSIEASSLGVGQGATFTLRIPLRRPGATSGAESTPGREAPSAPEMAAATRVESWVRRRVLIVDDDPGVASGLLALFRALGQEVRVVHDGPTALDVAPDFAPELVVLDLGMPRMSGLEVARRLRGLPSTREAVLVALSGYADERVLEQVRASCFDHYLTKPAYAADLTAILARLPDRA